MNLRSPDRSSALRHGLCIDSFITSIRVFLKWRRIEQCATRDATELLHHVTSRPSRGCEIPARKIARIFFSFFLLAYFLVFLCAKIRAARETAGLLPRLRQSRGRDPVEFGGVGRALLRRRSDPENPRPGGRAVGAQVRGKVLAVGLLRAAGALRGWRDRPADRRSYRSVEVTRCGLAEHAFLIAFEIALEEFIHSIC